MKTTLGVVLSYTTGAPQVVLVVKNLSANAGDIRNEVSVLALRRFTEEGHGNSLQYSCMENP